MNLNDIVITSELRERFEKYVYPDPNSGCFIWAGPIRHHGYGGITVNHRGVLAHRLAWVMSGRKLTRGLSLLHKCDTPCCVNPDHLFEGTHQDNMDDMVRKGRSRRGKYPPGVWKNAKGVTFGARVYVGPRRYRYVGCFATMEEAAAAAKTARCEVR